MYISLEELKKATQLTREGKLKEATSAIQRALGSPQDVPPGSPTAHPDVNSGMRLAPGVPDFIDVEVRELPASPETGASAAPQQQDTGQRESFEAHHFSSGGRTYTYRLYTPPRRDAKPLPVILMLHGCTQDALDFAAGTAMNELAAQHGCIVVYPEQPASANSMRCWNWFDPSHQQRGRGEPAMLAALAAHVVARCHGDAQRVYVAGLSAGGAMAAVAGQLYPDVFAAIGVHSGLPAAAATDVRSAHAAMRKPARKPDPRMASTAALPTIVFHGRSDRTVHPENGRQVIEEAAARAAAAGIALKPEEHQVTVAGRPVKRTVYKDAGEVRFLEHWDIAGAPHAWSGGKAPGSYVDVSGPSASAAMIDFFLLHHK
jgi:poly(hydroxyalkanoate) depolymerase family esterase